jgi:hypothetical protein
MAVSMKMAVFWVVVPCSLVESKLLPDYTVLQTRRQPSPVLKLRISP